LTYIRIIIVLALVLPTGLLSCANNRPAIRYSTFNLFRSKDFIIYQLPSAATPAELAEKFLGDNKKSWYVEESNPGVDFSSGESIVIPLNNINKAGLRIDGFQTIPILTYHRFAEDCNSLLCLRSSTFEHQMRYLKENGFHVTTPEELLAFLEYKQGLPKKSVMITMDDGYRSVYEVAYPILKKYDFTATLFIYTNFVGASKMAVSWDQLKKMKADGFSIGSHTIYHSDLTIPKDGETKADWMARINEELYGSKKIIDKKLGQDTYLLAYPYGNYDQRSINIAKEAGYKIAMSVQRGGNPFFANALFLRRDQILQKDMQTFISRLNIFKPMSLK
jgi:peptidoglycan/xylan/chitin deacetylase (PgdA/CDA1 family)